MTVEPLELPGLLLLSLRVFKDARGFFLERFNLEKFRTHGLPTQFFQDNHSRSLPGVLRGMHFQSNPAQGKLIGVTRGDIWDVVIDLRCSSPAFGKNIGLRLSGDTGQMLWVPAGFAHGFCVLGHEPADVYYKVDARYDPASEGGIRWNDPELAIDWPSPAPIVSERDQRLGSFADYKKKPVFG